MSNVESRSIINAPIRRSFDVIQSQANDLANTVETNETTAATNHRKSAWGVVARGSFIFGPNVTMGAGAVRNSLTNALSYTFVKDRYYEVRCVLRAIGASFDPDGDVIEPNDLVGFYAVCNVNGSDRGGQGQHVQAVDRWQGANFSWILRCPTDVPVGASSVTILLTDERSLDTVIYTDTGSYFLIQDIGSTLP